MRDILADIITAACLFGTLWALLILGHAAGF